MTKPILLFGPTASGKTDLSIELAKQINAEIISADSMQVYRFMDIGTAKPSPEQRKTIPHHLIDVVNPDQEWTVSEFIKRTKMLIKEISIKGKKTIIVGGTGLYLNSFINGYSFPIVPKNELIRRKLSKIDIKELYNKLQIIDSKSAEKIHSNDKKRIIRALEVYEQTGIPISKLQKKKQNKNLILICLNIDRELLYERINERVDKMIQDGFVEEVKYLIRRGYNRNLASMQAIGYKQIIEHL